MPLCCYIAEGQGTPRFGAITGDRVIDLAAAGGPESLAGALQMPAEEMSASIQASIATAANSLPLKSVSLRAPIDAQEVWAAGVTYSRSRDARMEESTQRDIYDRVYDADRPELFLKATPGRVAGPGEPIAIRGDSDWDVPEPELTLLLNAHGDLVGYTIGNDVSSRSIEGDNPLYLPQAKVFAQCAALGPMIFTVDEAPDVSDLAITLTIERDGAELFSDSTSTSRIHRSLSELTLYLFRCNTFPDGVFLMTGTGIVPPSEFTLQAGDVVTIQIAQLGSLTNPVVRLPA